MADANNYRRINAVDAIKDYSIEKGITYNEAHDELLNYGFLELSRTEVKTSAASTHTKRVFDLTKEARKILQSGKSFSQYLLEKLEKDKRDEYFRGLQIRDLEEKVNVMNNEQKIFWNEQRIRNKHLTLIAIIGLIISIFSLFKSMGFFK